MSLGHARPRPGETIADVEGAEEIEEAHLAEAINYRALDTDLST